MSKIKAGDLRHPVTLKKPVITNNEKGKPITSWVPVNTVYAEKKDVSGREFYVAQAHHAADTVTFTIRWRDDIDATWRVYYHGKPYEVLAINGLGEMRDFMRLKCKLIQGEGGT